MKVHFSFNCRKYIAPSKIEARKFLKFWGDRSAMVLRLKTTWKIKHVEIAALWAQVERVDLPGVEYGKK